jgi:CelD/BcsL family acetyltransferase involved in cellulose biosynthesis
VDILNAQVADGASALDGVRDDWNRLAERSGNVFGTWEWASTWWRHFGNGARPLVTTCRTTDAGVVALIPLYVSRQAGLRVVRLIGHGPADELGPLCAVEDRPAAAAALQRELDEARADVFLAEDVRDGDDWSKSLGATVRATGMSPILPLRWRSWDEFLAARSSNFRQQVRRRERALGNRGLGYRLCENRDQLERDLDVLFALHASRWPGGTSQFTRHEAFHRDFAARAFDRGWLRLWFLELNGTPVAAWYGLRFHGIDLYYQAGRDPAWDQSAVGFVLLAHSLREAIADGMSEYRFGRGGEEYKSRFTDDDSKVETLVLACGPTGRLAVAAAEAARRCRRALRRGVPMRTRHVSVSR